MAGSLLTFGPVTVSLLTYSPVTTLLLTFGPVEPGPVTLGPVTDDLPVDAPRTLTLVSEHQRPAHSASWSAVGHRQRPAGWRSAGRQCPADRPYLGLGWDRSGRPAAGRAGPTGERAWRGGIPLTGTEAYPEGSSSLTE